MPKRERRRSSVSREQTEQALKNLPMLKDTAAAKRHDLFKQKLELCSVRFNFDDMNSNKRGKELKRSTLLELVDFVNKVSGGIRPQLQRTPQDYRVGSIFWLNNINPSICPACRPKGRWKQKLEESALHHVEKNQFSDFERHTAS